MPRWQTPILLLALGAFPLPARADKPFRFPEGSLGKNATLKYHGNLPVLTVSGTPEEIGTAVGKLALKPGSRVLGYPKAALEEFRLSLLWKRFVALGKEMVGRFPPEYQKELQAMRQAAGAAEDDLIAGNTLFDIKKMALCSSLMVEGDRSATGGPLLGRNLDYPSLGWIQDYSLVTVYRPRGKKAFVSVGFPGLVGVLSGMNEDGLAVAVHEVFACRADEGRFNAKGLPYAVCFRKVLEECSTIEQARTCLEKLPRTTLNCLVVADKKGVAVLEITPKSVVLRRAEKHFLACTNHFCTELKPSNQFDPGDSFERYSVLEKGRTVKKFAVAEMFRFLHAVNLGEWTLQSMVFEPATLKMHLAIGAAPATRMKPVTLELAPLFGK
jgi:hypothetical protein